MVRWDFCVLGGELMSWIPDLALFDVPLGGGVSAPTASTLLTVTMVSGTQIDLSWTDNSTSETGFSVERSADGLTGWVEVGTTGAGVVVYSDTDLTANTTYYYRVRAFRGAVYSAYTNIVSAKTLILGRFQFTVDDPAPLDTPYTEPGAAGALTLIQTDGQFSKSGGKLVFGVQATPTWGDQGFYDATGRNRVLGLIAYGKVNKSTGEGFIALSRAASISFGSYANVAAAFHYQSVALTLVSNAAVLFQAVQLTNNVTYEFALVARAAGCFYFIRGGVFANWTILGVVSTDTTALLYAAFSNLNGVGTLDDFLVDQLALAKVPRPLLSDSFNSAVIRDHGDLGLHGDPVYVKLDGVKGGYKTSYTNIYSAELNRVFDGQELTLIAYGKTNSWTVANKNILRLLVDGSNYIDCFIPSSGYFQFKYLAGGVDKGVTKGGLSTTDYFSVGLTASKTTDALRAFYNGTQEGADITGLGTWAGSLDYRYCNLGAAYGAIQNWDGGIKDLILSVKAPGQTHAVVATPAQVAEIHTRLAAGTLDKAYLDSVFGASGYIWLRHTDTYLSDGRGHVEGQTVRAIDRGGNALHGVHSNVYLPGGAGQYRPGKFTVYTDIYSAALNTKFNGQASFAVVRGKVSNAGVWADGTARYILRIRVDNNNYIYLAKSAVTGRVTSSYSANSVQETITKDGVSTAGYFVFGTTFSKAAGTSGEFKVYWDGAQEGSTQETLGSWAGNLSSSSCVMGALDNSGGSPWDGDISDAIIGLNGVVATPTQMADLNTYLAAGTLTEVILNAMFGANNWAWYSFDEVGLYDGAALLWGGEGSWAKDASGNAVAVPASSGAESAPNGTMEAGSPPSNWNPVTSTLSRVEDQATGGVGSYSLGVARNGSNTAYARSTNITTVPGIWYELIFSTKLIDAVSSYGWFRDVSTGANMGGTTFSTATSWANLSTRGRAINTASAVQFDVNCTALADGVSARFDDVSLKAIPFSELIRTIDVAEDDVIVMAKLTVDALYQAGVTISADSQSNPLNFLYAYIDRTLAKLYFCKVLNGTPETPLIDAAITYSASAQIEVHKRGTEYRVIYANALIGTVQTISDAAIISNTRHGAFSTGTGGKVESLAIWDNGYSSNRYAALAGY